MEKLTEQVCSNQMTFSEKVPEYNKKGLFRHEKDLFISVDAV